jgi:nicotinamidase-related amidase
MEVKRNSKILVKEKTALLIIDVQQKLFDVMHNKDELVENTIKLIKGMKILGAPIFFTEQYPKGLGNTIAEIKNEIGTAAIQKMSFSCSGAEDLFKTLIDKNISQIVVCGIESHVCVQQTVLDLIENGFQVNVAADAVSSRREFDLKIALERMRANKAEITTVESVLFELLNICGTDNFKSIIKIVK